MSSVFPHGIILSISDLEARVAHKNVESLMCENNLLNYQAWPNLGDFPLAGNAHVWGLITWENHPYLEEKLISLLPILYFQIRV